MDTLYAYVRVMDDMVDKKPVKKDEFILWSKKTRQALKGMVTKIPIIDNFAALSRKHNFKDEWVEAFIESMEMDLKPVDMKSYRELMQYIFGSAEVIGLMMAKILQLPKASYRPAKLQGRAMQYLNFIRDIDEDRQLNRIYMPREDREKFKIGDNDWDQKKWSKLIRYQIRRYRKLQAEAEVGYPLIPRRLRIPVKTAAKLYSWTAETIYQDPSLVFERKVKPSKWRIGKTLVSNYLAV